MEPLFDAKAIKGLTTASRGIPRLINVLAHKALLLAYGEGKKQINLSHIRSAIIDTEDASRLVGSGLLWSALALFAVGGSLAAVGLWLAQGIV